MESQIVTLRGPAVADLAALAAALLEAGCDVEVVTPTAKQRDFNTILTDAAVGLAVSGTYDVVKILVNKWLSKRGLSENDADVQDGGQEDNGRSDSE